MLKVELNEPFLAEPNKSQPLRPPRGRQDKILTNSKKSDSIRLRSFPCRERQRQGQELYFHQKQRQGKRERGSFQRQGQRKDQIQRCGWKEEEHFSWVKFWRACMKQKRAESRPALAAAVSHLLKGICLCSVAWLACSTFLGMHDCLHRNFYVLSAYGESLALVQSILARWRIWLSPFSSKKSCAPLLNVSAVVPSVLR